MKLRNLITSGAVAGASLISLPKQALTLQKSTKIRINGSKKVLGNKIIEFWMPMRTTVSYTSLVVFFLMHLSLVVSGNDGTIWRAAKNTVTPVEMDKGDTLKFKLRNGQIRTMVLLETDAD